MLGMQPRSHRAPKGRRMFPECRRIVGGASGPEGPTHLSRWDDQVIAPRRGAGRSWVSDVLEYVFLPIGHAICLEHAQILLLEADLHVVGFLAMDVLPHDFHLPITNRECAVA